METIKIKKEKKIKTKKNKNKNMLIKEKIYNEEFINILDELNKFMLKDGEHFRAKAYQKAKEVLENYNKSITKKEQIKELEEEKGVGPTIIKKLEEYFETGKIEALENLKKNPSILFVNIYGIGPKKAKQLVKEGIKTLDELKKRNEENPELLNAVQKKGLMYELDIKERIPRQDIDEFKKVFEKKFKEVAPPESTFEIVGSYRRGAEDSGDIDIIITNKNDDKKAYDNVLNELIKDKIIVEVLSRGNTKSLTLGRISPKSKTRRIDFLWAPPSTYAFALLYFTGSKNFNTIMRQRALNLGYTLNEHGIYKFEDGIKGKKIEENFPNEESIFNFLNMKFKEPNERIDGSSFELKEKEKEEKENKEKEKEEKEEIIIIKVKKNKTIKKKDKDENQDLEDFKKEGISILKIISASKDGENRLTKILKEANDAYYCSNNPILTDNTYDILREFVLNKYPKNPVAKEGHASCLIEGEKNKVKLPYEMWSMDKIKPDTSTLEKWKEKYKGPYIVSCKLDGVSGLYSTEGGMKKLYTRGNGKIGQDISYLIPYLNISESISISIPITIRGEFIIKKNLFDKKYKDKFSNPRNFVAGVINQKKVDNEKIKDIDFIAYEVISPSLKPLDQMRFLEKNKIKLVRYLEEENITNKILTELLILWRKDYKYEIDGIIVINNEIYPRPKKNPEYAFAFKMALTDQMAEAKVVDIIWTPSKDGLLKPRVQIEPVILGGAKIEYATGFNAKFIKDNKIGLGSVVSLIRSGDVIPHITGVINEAEEPLFPKEDYEWNKSNVDILLKNKEKNDIVQQKNLTKFFKVIGVEGLGEGNIKRIIESGNDSIPKIIGMKEEDFLEVDGFKKKMAEKIYKGIKEKIKKASLPELMTASNSFGYGFGEKIFKKILEKYPNILESKKSDKEKIEELKNVDGLAEKTSEKFIKNLPDFLKFIQDSNLNNKLKYQTQSQTQSQSQSQTQFQTQSQINKKKIVFTGTRPKELMKKIEELGGSIQSTINSKTFALITNNLDESTGKIDKANELKIPIYTSESFEKEFIN